MPPHLHPRSRLTSSLFATTLFASFFVVALPHVLPCPAPRVAYADSAEDGTPQRRRRRRKYTAVDGEGEPREVLKDAVVGESAADTGDEADNGMGVRKLKRECPVPKPGVLMGEILGFKGSSSSSGGNGKRPP